MSQFGSAVTLLGEGTYPNAFAGAYATGCDRLLTIEVVSTASDSSAFLAAVAAKKSADTPYNVVNAANSWTFLSELTDKLASVSLAEWKSLGISVDSFGPDSSTDRVLVTLQQPTSDDLVSLNSTAQSVLGSAAEPVTPANYIGVAGQVLVALYDDTLSVSDQYGPVATFASGRDPD